MNDPLLNPNAPFLPKKEGQVTSVVELSSDAVVLNTTQDSVQLKDPMRKRRLGGILYPLGIAIYASAMVAFLSFALHDYDTRVGSTIAENTVTEHMDADY